MLTKIMKIRLKIVLVAIHKLRLASVCLWFAQLIGLHHPLDGVTNPKYKLLHFIQLTKFFCKKGH